MDLQGSNLLESDIDLDPEHPGFSDTSYRRKREEIILLAHNHKINQPIPNLAYSEQEQEAWYKAYTHMAPLHEKYACDQYNQGVDKMKKELGYSEFRLPQLSEINDYLKTKSGFVVKPVTGTITSREFLNFLAYKVFPMTPFIRHHSKPLFSPEPDIIHEIVGHVPMLIDKEFAEFTQEIGLAALGASEENVKHLAALYMFSVEVGILQVNNN